MFYNFIRLAPLLLSFETIIIYVRIQIRLGILCFVQASRTYEQLPGAWMYGLLTFPSSLLFGFIGANDTKEITIKRLFGMSKVLMTRNLVRINIL